MGQFSPQLVRGISRRFVTGLTSAALVAATAGHFAVPERTPVLTHEVVQVAAIDESPSTIGIADSNIYFTDSLDEDGLAIELTTEGGVKIGPIL